jgi:hypothetical protein
MNYLNDIKSLFGVDSNNKSTIFDKIVLNDNHYLKLIVTLNEINNEREPTTPQITQFAIEVSDEIDSIVNFYRKLYDTTSLKELFRIHLNQRYHLKTNTRDDAFTLSDEEDPMIVPVKDNKNFIHNRIFNWLSLRKNQAIQCMDLMQNSIEKDFFEYIVKNEYVPKNNSSDELKKACGSMRPGIAYIPELKHKVLELLKEKVNTKNILTDPRDKNIFNVRPSRVVPNNSSAWKYLSTINYDLPTDFNYDQMTLSHMEKQFVFGSLDDVIDYMDLDKLYVCCKMKIPIDRSSCAALAEWTVFMNNLYTYCASFTEANFIRFIMKPGTIHHPRKSLAIKDFSQMKLIGGFSIKFVDDRAREHTHPSMKKGILGHLFYFVFKLNRETIYVNRLYTEYSDIIICDLYGKPINLGTLFQMHSISYTEFNQLVYYLGMKTYRAIDNKHILFLRPSDATEPTSNELEKMDLEKAHYYCLYVPVEKKNKFYLRSMGKTSFEKIEFDPYVIFNEADEYKNYFYSIRIDSNFVFASQQQTFGSIAYDKLLEKILLKKKIYMIDSMKNLNYWNKTSTEDNKLFIHQLINKIILTHEHLAEDELNYLARKHNLMEGGSIVSINKSLNESDDESDDELFNEKFNPQAIFSNGITLSVYFLTDGTFEQFYQLSIKYSKLFPHPCDKNAIIESLFFNDYEFVMPELIAMRGHEIVKTFDERPHLKREIINPNSPPVYITKYIPHTNLFFFYYEIIHEFKLCDHVKNMLEITNYPSICEAVHYYQNKYLLDEIQMNTFYLSKYAQNHGKAQDDYINYYKYFYKTNFVSHDKYFDEDILMGGNLVSTENEAYDVIFSSGSLVFEGKRRFSDVHGFFYFVCVIILSLFKLNRNGNLIINLEMIKTKAMADLVVLCGEFFHETKLFTPKIHNKCKFNGTVVCFMRYIGFNEKTEKLTNYLRKIIAHYKKQDVTLYEKFHIDKTIYDENFCGAPGVNSTTSNPMYCEQLITSDLSSRSELYTDIINFNREFWTKKIFHLENLIKYKSLPEVSYEKIKYTMREKQIVCAQLYAHEFGFEYITFGVNALDKKFSLDIFSDIYSIHRPIIYKFNNTTFDVSSDGPPINELNILAKKLYLTDYLIDTRNIDEWFKIKRIVRLYSPSNNIFQLKTIVEKIYTLGFPISQAWLKMYEILYDLKLIEGTQTVDTLNTFHLCEAPGNFISACNHYIKTRTPIKNFNWYAQSLRSEEDHRKTNKRTAFGDDYGYIAKYPSRWIWGIAPSSSNTNNQSHASSNNINSAPNDNIKRATGDITNLDNILYYEKRFSGMKIHFMTSDCGLPNDENQFAQSETPLTSLHIIQLVLIMLCLSKGGAFVAKFFIPLNSLKQIAIINLIKQNFNELIFYKGVINIFSKEFYVIGRGYKGINSELREQLMKILEGSYDVSANKYANEFNEQIKVIMNRMVDNYIANFDRQLYYVDNCKYLDENNLNMVKKIVIAKNKEWIREHELKEIDKRDIM